MLLWRDTHKTSWPLRGSICIVFLSSNLIAWTVVQPHDFVIKGHTRAREIAIPPGPCTVWRTALFIENRKCLQISISTLFYIHAVNVLAGIMACKISKPTPTSIWDCSWVQFYHRSDFQIFASGECTTTPDLVTPGIDRAVVIDPRSSPELRWRMDHHSNLKQITKQRWYLISQAPSLTVIFLSIITRNTFQPKMTIWSLMKTTNPCFRPKHQRILNVGLFGSCMTVAERHCNDHPNQSYPYRYSFWVAR